MLASCDISLMVQISCTMIASFEISIVSADTANILQLGLRFQNMQRLLSTPKRPTHFPVQIASSAKSSVTP